MRKITKSMCALGLLLALVTFGAAAPIATFLVMPECMCLVIEKMMNK